ncbi:acetolactate synthase large subunit [Nonomuraea sp. NPDC049158]|uniref:acetolactate synthase large subunit n=1 Tax=Nonomuraea sp. NPDC049158 TaxID=3155649 RepID=UPI0033F159FD
MNGAQALLRTLVGAGVRVCFTNPGTSEMHFVAALDEVPEMRAVLALFEGVATGAADGYARMAGQPAATLLHLGPGLGNGLANLHNAAKGRSGVVNIVGDHATYHARYDAPLQSDIATVARNVSGWVRTPQTTAELPGVAAEAVAVASGPPGQVATLILPADVSWEDGAEPALPAEPPKPAMVEQEVVRQIAAVLGGGNRTALLLGGRALQERGLLAAAKIAAACGVRVLAETFPARLERGAGLPGVDRLAYLAEFATTQLADLDDLVLVDAKEPVSFFAYPGKPSRLAPDGCRIHRLTGGTDDVPGALEALVETADATGAAPAVQQPVTPQLPSGPLSAQKVCQAIGAVLPPGAIISDEAQTSGIFLAAATAGAPRHDLLCLTGGSIGQGLPVAVGAAVACPDRPVIALEADGSALYTPQALWTMARENLDVTVVLFNNRSYAVLNMELDRVGAGSPGPRAKTQLDLSEPPVDFVALASGLGVPASRPDTAEELLADLRRALAEPGPHLIEAVIPPIF